MPRSGSIPIPAKFIKRLFQPLEISYHVSLVIALDHLTPLPRQFYLPSARVVAPRLLGHLLVRQTPKGPVAGVIVETEAYLSNDPACHAASGETPRNKSMWGEHGRSYVYLIYGYHFCFNTVCKPAGTPEAVLVRALEPCCGHELMQENRQVRNPIDLTNGPAKFCAAMGITRFHDGLDLCDKSSPLFVASNPRLASYKHLNGPIVVTTRIGISKAADLPLRFYFAESPWVSRKNKAALPLRRNGPRSTRSSPSPLASKKEY